MKMKKKIHSFLALALCLVFVTAFLPITTSAAEVSKFDGNYYSSTKLRTEGNNVYIDSANDLALFVDTVNVEGENYAGKTVLLTKDIVWNEGDATQWDKTPPQYDWTQIGVWTKFFSGTFDGQGHTVSGLYIKAEADNRGFFGCCTQNVTIKNLAIKNSYFENSTHRNPNMACLIGVITECNLTVENVYCDAIVNCTGDCAAMLIGYVHGNTPDQKSPANSKVTIRNCAASGSVTGGLAIGGLIGFVWNEEDNRTQDITIENCISNVKVNGKDRVGGIMADRTYDGKLSMKNVINTGMVTVTSADAVPAAITSNIARGNGSMKVENAYYLKGTATQPFAANNGAKEEDMKATELTEDKLKGEAAKANLTGFDFDNTWVAVENGYPLPKYVAQMIGAKTLGASNPPVNPGNNNNNPGTSDSNLLIATIGTAVVAVAAAVTVIIRKRKRV